MKHLDITVKDIVKSMDDETLNSLDMEELQAINQQAKELGWLDEDE